MQLYEALQQNKVKGFSKPEKEIETMISRVFVFENSAVKVYKWENFFFADLSDYEYRKKFYQDDFYWNNSWFRVPCQISDCYRRHNYPD